MIETVKKLLKQKEGIRLEFKEAKTDLPANLFESICSMLNRDGGDILLGVNDNGKIIGIDLTKLETLKTNIVNLSNNAQKIDPPFILFPLSYEINGKTIIHLQVSESSQVHKTNNTVFDRSNDGDFRVTQPHRIAEIYNRKRLHYTEGIIYPALKFSDFNADLFTKTRNLIRSNNPNHPWLALSNKQMLEKAGLWKRDFQTGQEGYTLAAILIFGKAEIIQQILPHYKIDALVRKVNTHRYDDREYIQTNLIDSYDALMGFVAKHLPDKFYIENGQRKSLRTAIFREIVANLIVHREYTNALPCTFTILKGSVETENANNPHGNGPISLDNFTPFPKNPLIAKFFIQIGRVEELGSGVMNVNRLLKEYTPGKKPKFIEGDKFKIVIPVVEENTAKVDSGKIKDKSDAVSDAVNDAIKRGIIDAVSDAVNDTLIDTVKIVLANNKGVSINEIMKNTGKSNASVKRYLQILKAIDLIEFKGSAKTGRYFITNKMK